MKESGTLITTPLDGGPVTEQRTMQCVHCGRHWVYQKGSGRRRGFCMNCYGITCGSPKCDPCVPFEQKLDNIESGRPADFRRIIVPGGYEKEK